jgi:hypothetical protein
MNNSSASHQPAVQLRGTGLAVSRFTGIATLAKSKLKFFRRFDFRLFAGTLLTATGLCGLVGGISGSQLLLMQDPLFGLPFRTLMLFLGSAQLFLGLLFLFARKRSLASGEGEPRRHIAVGIDASLICLAWLSVLFVGYRITLWVMGWHHSCGFLVEPLGLSLTATDMLFSGSAAVLLIGSCVSLWIERRMMLRVMSLKISCPSCAIHIRFATQNVGQTVPCPKCKTPITLHKPEEALKMSCYFCKEHIEFPPHAIGRKIECPHCKQNITLKETVIAEKGTN